jgi:hypothetical protein
MMIKMNNMTKHKDEKEDLPLREKVLIRLIIKAAQQKREKLRKASLSQTN